MTKRITNPTLGTVVHHTGWMFKDNKNYPCDVLITSGKYMSNGRLSNAWHWNRILPNGEVCNEDEHGYGSFVEPKNKYPVTVVVQKEKS